MAISYANSSSVETKTKTAPTAEPEAQARSFGSLKDLLQHLALGTAWAIKPERIRVLPWVTLATVTHYLTPKRFRKEPDPAVALNYGEGLVGICGSLTPEIVLKTYTKGLYAFCHIMPLKWWSPPVRSILFFDKTHLEKNLKRLLRQKKYQVTFDTAFDEVIDACAAPRPGRRHLTWINDTQKSCFKKLHKMGHAHSVEVWDADGELVGGLYGLATGGVFFTESQFFTKRDASKVGFAVLNQHLQKWGFAVNDGKNETPHLKQTGFENVSRAEFRKILTMHAAGPFKGGRWQASGDLDVSSWLPAEADGLKREDLMSA